MTFFFNGGVEAVFPGEDRVLVASPKVATYDLQPEMSAVEVTDKCVGKNSRLKPSNSGSTKTRVISRARSGRKGPC